MIISRVLKTVLVGLVVLTQLTCKRNTTGPGSLLPGKREYVWTIDTLAYPGSFQTDMRSMYATSSDNVYIVGHNDQNRGKMYHYNGQQWSPVILTASEGGLIQGAIDLTAIHGSGPNDIWAVGEETYYDPLTGRFSDTSLVIHYDGVQWRKVDLPKRRTLWCVWVVAPNQVFAGSADGVLYRYDGERWTTFELGVEFFLSSVVGISSNEAYAMGNREDKVAPIDSSGTFLFRFDGNSWHTIDSLMRTPGSPPQHFGYRLISNGGFLYSSAPNIYKYENNRWRKLFDGPVTTFSASGSNNMLAVGQSVYHFNGHDWYEYANFRSSNWLYHDCYANGEEVFVIGSTGFISIILHGK